MGVQRVCTDFDSEPLYTKLYNLRLLYNPAEYTLEMGIDVQRLRMENLLSQPAPPPQCDSSPLRSPAVGTELDEPGALHVESQATEREGYFHLEASLDSVFNVCASTKQGANVLLQPDVKVDIKETTTTNAQAAAREEFAKTPKNRQQERVTGGPRPSARRL